MRIAAALIGITLILVSFLARAESDLEIKLQSAFIYRFVHYVKWNSPKWMDQNELSVSVFGDRKLFLTSTQSQIAKF